MKTSRLLFLLMALTVFAANAVAQNPYTKSFSQAGVVPNRTGWSFWYMPTGVADTLNVKVSYVDTGMASHTPHAHNHDELFILLEGEAILHLNGTETTLHPGDGFMCPGGSSHNIQRADPDHPILYLMFTRETAGGIPAPHQFRKPDYSAADCHVTFRKGRSFWYLAPGLAGSGLNVRSITLRGRRVHHDPADGRQLVYFIMEGKARVTVDGAPVELTAPSVCYVPKGASGSIAAAGGKLRYLQVRTQ